MTRNLPFSGWGGVLGDRAVAAAMIDRVVHHTDVLTLNDVSYRRRNREIDTLPGIRIQDLANKGARTGGLVLERRIDLNVERCRQAGQPIENRLGRDSRVSCHVVVFTSSQNCYSEK